MANRAIVAAGHPQTAAAAAQVLADGGTAVDAALAGAAAACVAEPLLASLGGGGFLLARPVDGRFAGQSIVYDFFVQTPLRRRPVGEVDVRETSADFGLERRSYAIGCGTIATPGVVKGLFEAHRDLGRMPLRRLVEPACALARGGVIVSEVQGHIAEVMAPMLAGMAESRRLFAGGRDGETIRTGHRLANPELADVLEVLAIEGEALFYRGEIAQRLAVMCAGGGGHLTRADVERYQAERRPPLIIPHEGTSIQLNPPPASGGAVVSLGLALWAATGSTGCRFGSAEHLSRLVVALRTIDRLGDRSSPSDFAAKTSALLGSPAPLAKFAEGLDARAPVTRGATHISVVDAGGNAACLSLSNGEGSGVVLPGTGIMLNNMLGEGALDPEGPGDWPQDVRMSSTMAPCLLVGGDGTITALGAGGSKRIGSAILQVILNLKAFGLPPAEAVAAPRIHVEQDRLSVEPGFTDDLVERLARDFDACDRWDAPNLTFGGVHVARSGSRGLDGAGDARRDGAVVTV